MYSSMLRKNWEFTLEGDLIPNADQLQCPVMVVIAPWGVGRHTVEEVVRPSHTGVGVEASNKMLASDEGGLTVNVRK